MFDLHMHSIFSDGKHSPEEMILEGITRGMERIGVSDHGYAVSDDACMSPEAIAPYHAELRRLKEKYAGRIEVLLGIERDYYSEDFSDYDYVIGSVHSMQMPDGFYLCVDWAPEKLEESCAKYFGGDWYALSECYFRVEADVARKTKCDIIGHFDLVTKFNEKRCWFDPAHPRYRTAWQRAAETLLQTGKVFEINTGAISRGYRTDAYPSKEIRDWLRSRGAKMILSSDAHQKENICFEFERFAGEL